MNFKDRAKQATYALAGVAFAAVAAGGYTAINLNAQHRQVVDGLSTRLASLDGQVESLGRANSALQSRVHLSRAAVALRSSNFGSATEHMKTASASLTAACNGVTDCPYANVREEINQLGIQVTDDPTEQVFAVTLVEDHLDALLELP